jgi:hypothetical protein
MGQVFTVRKARAATPCSACCKAIPIAFRLRNASRRAPGKTLNRQWPLVALHKSCPDAIGRLAQLNFTRIAAPRR